MALVIKKIVEPLTPASEITAAQVITSDGMMQLVREMLRYARGEIVGRSYLIAGHRGVGKTTMVRNAVELVERQLKQEKAQLRPLYVDLHGPDLVAGLPESTQPAAKAGDTDGANRRAGAEAPGARPGAAETKPAQTESDWKNFIERLTFGLYRAAATEFSKRFRLAEGGRNPELAGQFEVELDRGANLRRLREFYREAGVLRSGVLFGDNERGVAELTLLANAGQAYRVISGQVKGETKTSDQASQKTNLQSTIENLAPPFAGLLAGSLTWGALGDAAGSPVKVISAILTGLAGVMAVKIASSRGRETGEEETTSFMPLTDRASLRRVLPVLVERFRSIGLVPVFVVDELDKVDEASRRIRELMGYLKQFVTERAFFCFLADREYYDSIEAEVAGQPYPREATLFGERLFVQYRVKDLHAYLDQLLPQPQPTSPEDQKDLELFPYVLLRRSFLHPFTLRRLLFRYTNENGEVRVASGALFNDFQYRNDVLMQVAVECVLAEIDMSEYVEDPSQAQLAYDALYYPARMWEKGQELEIDKKALKKHLLERMRKTPENGSVPDQDLDFLYDALERVVAYLQDPKKLAAAMGSMTSVTWPEAVKLIVQAAGPLLVAP